MSLVGRELRKVGGLTCRGIERPEDLHGEPTLLGVRCSKELG